MVTFGAKWKHHFKVKTAVATFGAIFGENVGYFLFSTSGHTGWEAFWKKAFTAVASLPLEHVVDDDHHLYHEDTKAKNEQDESSEQAEIS